MNLILLQRFKNELIVLFATIFLILSFYYKLSIDNSIKKERDDIKTSIQEIDRVIALKDVWKSKKISKNMTKLRTIVSKDKIELFKKRGQKLRVKYKGLNIKELNSIVKEIMNKPFQIVKLKIDKRAKESYSMELICR
jgi:hypothetical protein